MDSDGDEEGVGGGTAMRGEDCLDCPGASEYLGQKWNDGLGQAVSESDWMALAELKEDFE